MTNRNVISVHTQPEIASRLNALATATKRSRSYLANEAIERYLAEEESFIVSVHLGIADADAGNLQTTMQAKKFISDHLVKSASKSAV